MRYRISFVSILQFLALVTCTRIDLDPFQDLILDQHNEYRREEQASNMCLMKWNNSLATEAARWADRCEFKHEMKSGLGENLAFDTRKMETEKLLDGLMNGWHDEKRMWRYGSQPCGFACHFTQIVWHSTNTIGCAATRCPSMTGMMSTPIKNAFYLVCFYYPRGNWIGQVAYVPGRACSKCDEGATCSQELCDNTGVNNGAKVAAAPAPLALKQQVSKAKNPFSFITKTSRFETFSHGSGTNRKTVSRGISSLHRSGPQALRAIQPFRSNRPGPQALRSRQTFRSNSFVSQSDQGRSQQDSRVGSHYSRSSQEVSHTPQHRRKPKRKQRSRCRDRLPACFKWIDRCTTNRAMKIMCPKSCDACDMVISMVDGRSANGHVNGHTRQEVRSGSVGQRHGHAQNNRSARQHHNGQQRQQHKSQRHHRQGHNRQHNRHHQQQQKHQRQQQQQNHHQHLKHKQSTHRAQKNQENSVLAQRDNPFCTDSAAFAKRCIYWSKTGFCKENFMMRDMYCKKSCGSC